MSGNVCLPSKAPVITGLKGPAHDIMQERAISTFLKLTRSLKYEYVGISRLYSIRVTVGSIFRVERSIDE